MMMKITKKNIQIPTLVNTHFGDMLKNQGMGDDDIKGGLFEKLTAVAH